MKKKTVSEVRCSSPQIFTEWLTVVVKNESSEGKGISSKYNIAQHHPQGFLGHPEVGLYRVKETFVPNSDAQWDNLSTRYFEIFFNGL